MTDELRLLEAAAIVPPGWRVEWTPAGNGRAFTDDDRASIDGDDPLDAARRARDFVGMDPADESVPSLRDVADGKISLDAVPVLERLGAPLFARARTIQALIDSRRSTSYLYVGIVAVRWTCALAVLGCIIQGRQLGAWAAAGGWLIAWGLGKLARRAYRGIVTALEVLDPESVGD